MGLISRVSSRTYRKKAHFNMGVRSSGHGKKSHTRKFNKNTGKIKRASKKKDDDVLFANLTETKKVKKLQNQPIQLEVAGLAQHYCIICNRYFNNEKVHKDHMRGKSHKQKVKSMKKDKPYSHKEAAQVAGQGSYVKPEVTAEEAQKIQYNAAFTKTLN